MNGLTAFRTDPPVADTLPAVRAARSLGTATVGCRRDQPNATPQDAFHKDGNGTVAASSCGWQCDLATENGFAPANDGNLAGGQRSFHQFQR